MYIFGDLSFVFLHSNDNVLQIAGLAARRFRCRSATCFQEHFTRRTFIRCRVLLAAAVRHQAGTLAMKSAWRSAAHLTVTKMKLAKHRRFKQKIQPPPRLQNAKALRRLRCGLGCRQASTPTLLHVPRRLQPRQLPWMPLFVHLRNPSLFTIAKAWTASWTYPLLHRKAPPLATLAIPTKRPTRPNPNALAVKTS